MGKLRIEFTRDCNDDDSSIESIVHEYNLDIHCTLCELFDCFREFVLGCGYSDGSLLRVMEDMRAGLFEDAKIIEQFKRLSTLERETRED